MTDSRHLLPLLLDIEADLERDLSLTSLASRFGTSAFHFHRSFSDSVGETPKQHIERLRLEKAAMQLEDGDLSVTELAFSLGYRNLETFSRRFKAALGHSPSAYRRMARAAQAERVASRNFHDGSHYYLSRARFETLPAMPLIAERHVGDYAALNVSFGTPGNAWDALADWARARGLDVEPIFIGFYYDDPTLTPVAQRRCDLCVPLRVASNIPAIGMRRMQRFDGGLYAFAHYAGDGEHLLQAYQGLADEIRRSAYTFRNSAPLLFPRAANVGGTAGLHRYDVAFPVVRRKG